MSPRVIRLLQLSDLHFGRTNPIVLKQLRNFILERSRDIDLIVLTGDLTQRAKRSEFLAARDFVERLPCPVFLIPGNHDVPLYNVFLRFFSPYKKFCDYLGPHAANFYENDALAIYGIWSTNRFTVKKGKLTAKEVAQLEQKLGAIPSNKLRLIATHHGLFPLQDVDKRVLGIHPHIVLSGHEHQSGVTQWEGSTLLISCGTSASTRTKTEANSLNLITIESNQVAVDTYFTTPLGFIPGASVKTHLVPFANSFDP